MKNKNDIINDMEIITGEELKEMLDSGEEFKLVMALGELAYNSKRIPGSIRVHSPDMAREHLDQNDIIVIYCTNLQCPASPRAYRMLIENGYSNVRRYPEGLEGWEAAGYPLEGDDV